MPDVDDGGVNEMLRRIIPMTSSLKNDDMRREKDMMEFQASLQRRNQPQASPAAPMKKNIVYGGIHPPTQMQQQFRQDDVAARSQRDRMATLGATQAGALNNALITGKQTDDADMAQKVAEINGRSDVARSNRLSVERAADDARTDKAKTDEIARTQKGPLVNVAHPRTGQMESRQYNPVTRKYEGIKIDDDQAGTGYKQGTIPKAEVNPGQDPAKLAAVRKSAQSALDELDQLVDADGSLKTHTSDAVGKSRIVPDLMDKVGMGSFTPSTTKGREGLKSLKAKLVLDVIGQMKAQSRTGATGFGALNLKELAVLEAAASKLENRDLSDEDFKAELGRIKDRLKLIIEDSPGGSDADKRADEIIKAARGGR